jgi:hypothetical protein
VSEVTPTIWPEVLKCELFLISEQMYLDIQLIPKSRESHRTLKACSRTGETYMTERIDILDHCLPVGS